MPEKVIKRDMHSSDGHSRMLAEARVVRECQSCGRVMFRTPVLSCKHCGSVLPIRCHSFRRKGFWYAECLDLNLLSRAKTQKAAVAELQQEMITYLDAAFSGSDLKGLIPRKAPFSSWVRYYLHRASVLTESVVKRHKHSEAEFQNYEVAVVSHCH